MNIGLEATDCYGDLEAIYLRKTSLIPRAGKAVRVLNPKKVSRFKKSDSEILKTNGIDAFVIADKLRFRCIGVKGTVVEDKYLSLQKLTRSQGPWQGKESLSADPVSQIPHVRSGFPAVKHLRHD